MEQWWSSCGGSGGSSGGAVVHYHTLQAQANRDFMVTMAANEEKRRAAERAHELEMAKTFAGNGGCATQ